MSQRNLYKRISKKQFESFLGSISGYIEFRAQEYLFDWVKGKDHEWQKIDSEIKERCYFLPLDSKAELCLKIYSSIDKITDFSRESGRDSIKIVVARTSDLKPIRPKFTYVKRIDTWEKNLRLRIAGAFKSLGVQITCPRCGNPLVPWKNRSNNSRFLACTKSPVCRYTRTISS